MEPVNIVVLDGSLASQLSKHVDGTPLWISGFVATDPQACVATHLDFLNVGAGVVHTFTYQSSVEGYMRYMKLTEKEAEDVIRKAVHIAKDARQRFLQERKVSSEDVSSPLVTGSVGPYGAMLHDGSEYTGDYASRMTMEEFKDWHRPRVKLLVDEGVDILAFETIPAQKEAEALVSLLAEFPKQKAWLSFSSKDERHLGNGDVFADAVEACVARDAARQVLAYGCNCLVPTPVSHLLRSVRQRPALEDVAFVVYPNTGELYSVEKGWQPGTQSAPLESYVPEWLDLGVRFIGRCCRTYPEDTERIREAVNKWKKAKAS